MILIIYKNYCDYYIRIFSLQRIDEYQKILVIELNLKIILRRL
jgi:hypothetical protein